MYVSFLEASTPLTKSFALVNGEIDKTNYPHTLYFTSYTEEIKTLQSFYEALVSHADKHHCLLKGELQRDLNNESRAGSTTNTSTTEFLCLDLDGIKDIETVEQFIKILPAEFHTTDYIVQYSSSMGVEPDKGLSAHIFFLLSEPQTPDLLKEWLKHINLNTPPLENSFRLSKSGVVFKWPIDISVPQNDKLIYIAPPLLGKGIKDNFKGKRIQIIKKKQRKLSPDLSMVNAGVNKTKETKLLNRLRKAEGMEPKRNTGIKIIKNVEVARSPDRCVVTGIKEDREFVYLNLNGGDSWGYFHHKKSPDILYNFKGEPNYLIKDLLPSYYADVCKKPKLTVEDAQKDKKKQFHIFSDIKSSVYYRCIYTPDPESVVLNPTKNLKIANDFLMQYGIEPGEYVPEWDIEFRFDDDRLIDFKEKFVNLFIPPKYLIETNGKGRMPPVVKKIIYSAIGSDDKVFEHFINWLACILQYREKLGTAWLLHGTQGTGKGLLFHNILTPLIGSRYTAHTELGTFARQFNAFAEQSVFVLVDEVSIADINNQNGIMAKLKTLITEKRIDINKKGISEYTAENFTHYLFASNDFESIRVADNDRRFNIAPRQEQRLQITGAEVDAIIDELQDFADYLMEYEADLHRARTVIDTQARRDLQSLSKDGMTQTLDVLHTGDIDFLYDNAPTENEETSKMLEAMGTPIMPYREAVKEYYENKGKVSRNGLWSIVFFLTGKVFKTANNFTTTMSKRGLKNVVVKIGGKPTRGYRFDADLNTPLNSEILKWLYPDGPKLETVKKPARAKRKLRK